MDRLIKKYDIVPAEYGHWVDSRLYKDRILNNEELRCGEICIVVMLPYVYFVEFPRLIVRSGFLVESSCRPGELEVDRALVAQGCMHTLSVVK
jgi:hypothetical protein